MLAQISHWRTLINIFEQSKLQIEERKMKTKKLCEQYTQYVVCRTPIVIQEKNTQLIFDSYWSPCTNQQIYSCILDTNIVAKVCTDIIFSYLPDLITLEYNHLYSNFYDLQIQIDDNEYMFTHNNEKDLYNIIGSHSYMTRGQLYIKLIDAFEKIAKLIQPTNALDEIQKKINELLDDYIEVFDINTFLNIMCCILLIKDCTPEPVEKIDSF